MELIHQYNTPEDIDIPQPRIVMYFAQLAPQNDNFSAAHNINNHRTQPTQTKYTKLK